MIKVKLQIEMTLPDGVDPSSDLETGSFESDNDAEIQKITVLSEEHIPDDDGEEEDKE